MRKSPPLDRDTIEALRAKLASGVPYRQACALVGRPKSTMEDIIARGQDPLIDEWLEAVELGSAQLCEALVGTIMQAARGDGNDWRPAAFMLPRRFEEFRESTVTETTVKTADPNAQVAAALAALAAPKKGKGKAGDGG